MLTSASESRKSKFDRAIEKTKKNIENTLKMAREFQQRRIPKFITTIDEMGEEIIVFYD